MAWNPIGPFQPVNVGGAKGNLPSSGLIPAVNFGAIWDKYVNGNQAADILPGANFQQKQTQNNKKPQTPTQPQPPGNSGTFPGSSGGGGFGGGGSSYDPNVIAQYDQSIGTINSALGRLPNQLGIAQGNISNKFNTGLNEIETAKTKAKGTYDTQTTQNKQDYRTDKNSINDSASAGLKGLMRILGAYGAGGSSDMSVASDAVTDQASLERSGAGQNFAQNAQLLDTNWNNFLAEDENSRKKLNDWKTEQMNNAMSQSESTKQDLLSKLAELAAAKASYKGGNGAAAAQPYINQANAVASKIDELAKLNPTYNGVTAAYQAPTLGSYTVNEGGGATVGQTGMPAASSPLIAMLLGKQDEKIV